MDKQKKERRIKGTLINAIPFFLLSLLMDYLLKGTLTIEMLFRTIFVSIVSGFLFTFFFTPSSGKNASLAPYACIRQKRSVQGRRN